MTEKDANKDLSYQDTWGASPEKKEELAGKFEKNEDDTPAKTAENRANRAPAGDPRRPSQTPQGPSQ